VSRCPFRWRGGVCDTQRGYVSRVNYLAVTATRNVNGNKKKDRFYERGLHCVVPSSPLRRRAARGSAPGCRMLLILAGIISHSPHDSTDAFASTPDGQHLWVNSRRNRCVTPLKFPVSKRRARALDPSPPRGVELTSPPPLPRSAHPLPLRRHRTDVATGCGVAIQITALAFHPFVRRSTVTVAPPCASGHGLGLPVSSGGQLPTTGLQVLALSPRYASDGRVFFLIADPCLRGDH